MNVRPCRACGRMLTFAMGPNEKPLPLEQVKNPYTLAWNPVAKRYDAIPRDFAEDVFVNHWQTCPKAGELSKQDRPQKESES